MKSLYNYADKGFWATLIIWFLFTSLAEAGGLYLNEFGTPSMGTAGAGANAWANDASTSFHNAAGMTRLNGSQLMLTGGLLYGSFEFDPDPSTPIQGNDGGQAGGPAPLLAAFYVHSLSDDWKLGLNLISVSAAVLDFDDNWTGRYLVQDVSIFTLTLHPSIAYRVNDWLSIGGGVGILYGTLDETIAIQTSFAGDGEVEIDGDDFKVNFNLNALFEINERTRFGLTYASKIKPSFNGDVSISPLFFQAEINAAIVFPQVLRGSVYHQINNRWAVLGTVGWEEWSDFENITLTTARGQQLIPRNHDDTWKIAAGIHYKAYDNVLLQVGAAYDSSPIDDSEDRTPDMPLDEQIRLAFGCQYDWSEKINIGGAFTYAFLGDAEIDNSLLVGDFKSNDLYFFAVNVNWKF